MTFDEYMKIKYPRYEITDDSINTRKLRDAWEAATLAERERCLKVCHAQTMKNGTASDCERAIRARTK